MSDGYVHNYIVTVVMVVDGCVSETAPWKREFCTTELYTIHLNMEWSVLSVWDVRIDGSYNWK